jgi:hypothetical protein
MTGQLPLSMMETNFDQTLNTEKLKGDENGEEDSAPKEREERLSICDIELCLKLTVWYDNKMK